MKKFLNAVLILIVLSQTALADDKSAVRDLLKGKLDAVITVIKTGGNDAKARYEKTAEIVQTIFDFSLMAKLALGRKHWSDLTKENRDKFIKLFTKILKNSYLTKIDFYHDEKIVFEDPLEVKTKIHVPTYLISKDKKIAILYKFYQSHDNWKIYDVEIQGVSLIRSYRSQFSESLQKDTIEELMAKLEKMDSGKIPTPLEPLL